MNVCINKTHGRANDLLIVIHRQEIENAVMEVLDWDMLNAGEGMVRWRGTEEFKRTENALKVHKYPLEEHLKRLSLLDEHHRPTQRIVAIGNRNLGNNYGCVAWHTKKQDHFLCLRDEPLHERSYTCLIKDNENRLSIQTLNFRHKKPVLAAEPNTDLTHDIEWCTYGQQILRGGQIVDIETIIHEFYDIRHVLALDPLREDGRMLLDEIYGNSPGTFNLELFRKNALEQWKAGVPRSRYLHNCVGLSEDALFIVQREGTPEEIAYYFKELGAKDAIILDNGGSVACWTWWAYRSEDYKHPCDNDTLPTGGFIFTSPEYRPQASSIIAFILKGPVHTNIPPASTSVTGM